MRKYLILLGLILVFSTIVISDEVRLRPDITADDVTVPLPVTASQVVLTGDSAAADSSYGVFTTASFNTEGSFAVTGFARLRSIGGAVEDTLILHCITAMSRENSTNKDTLSVDTLAAAGTVEYWLGSCDGWIGADSLAPFADIWLDGEVWDSTSDSAGHGVEHIFNIDFEFDRVE